MKQYLEQRIKELNKLYDETQEKYLKEPNINKAKYYYTKLYSLDKSINELEKVLAMVE